MVITNAREGQKIRAARPYRFFGGARETIDKAYPGDVVGLVNPGQFGIGDTLTSDDAILYKEIPRFTPEAFAYLHNPNTAKYKQFRKGLDQLMQEGVIQLVTLSPEWEQNFAESIVGQGEERSLAMQPSLSLHRLMRPSPGSWPTPESILRACLQGRGSRK